MSQFEARELDEAWDERHEARLIGSQEWRRFVLDCDEFWAPVQGSVETDVEIAWDKARLDSIEACTRMEFEFPKELIDTYQIARLTAGGLDDDRALYPVAGLPASPGSIVVDNNNMLLKMLYPDIVGLIPSRPDPDLTKRFVQSMEMPHIELPSDGNGKSRGGGLPII